MKRERNIRGKGLSLRDWVEAYTIIKDDKEAWEFANFKFFIASDIQERLNVFSDDLFNLQAEILPDGRIVVDRLDVLKLLNKIQDEVLGLRKMKSLVFRIRKKYFDAILSGEKRVEYRKDSEFWKKRIVGAEVAVFICGKRVHRRKILEVERMKTPDWFSDQGKMDIDTPTCLAIHLGSEIKRA